MGIMVKAKDHPTGLRKMMGYYDHQRRYPGEEFEIEHESHFSKKWMEKVPAKGNVSVGIDLKGKKDKE